MIVVLSKFDDKNPWVSAGFDGCLQMPVSLSDLKAELNILLHLRQCSEELELKSEAMYKAVFEATGTATLLVDDDTTIVMANKTCLPFTGYAPEELIGTKWVDYVAPESLEIMLKYHKARRQEPNNAPFQYEVRFIKKAGDVRNVILQVSMLPGTKQSVVSMLDITERKLAEEALKNRESQLQSIFRAAPIGIGIVIDRIFIEVNARICEMTGFTPEELFGKSTKMIYPTLSDFEYVGSEKYRQIVERGIGVVETRWMRKDGSLIDILLSSTPLDLNDITKGTVFTALDITERKRAEKALRESEENYRRLFQDHAAVKLLIDPDSGDIVDANKSAADFYGWRLEELRKMKIHQINTLSPEEVYAEMQKARTLKKTYFEFRHRCADGSIKDVKVFSSKVEIKGKEYLHSIIHDATKEKELESQLLQAQKLESIGQLAGGVAHDFNNMLNVIIGYGEMISNKLQQGDPLRENARQIVEAGRRSMALTDQLLAFSRKKILQPKVLNINESLKSIEEMLRRLIGEDIELIMSLKEDLSNVKADPGQIAQVIMNMAVNARDAMPYGGKFIIETTDITLDESYDKYQTGIMPGNYVMITIIDTGCGMNKEILTRIFEPFFTTKQKGTGLGLSTVYGIVRQSGGNITVNSEHGKGTSFRIYLPATSSGINLDKDIIEKNRHRSRSEHILIVEDEPALQGLFKELISSLGYRVTVASNGGEALLLVEEKGLMPDIVITDVVMPVMSGALLVERLRRSHPGIKVLYMSGYTDDAIIRHGVHDGDVPFIQKPFNLNELASKLESI